jgi:hypothetical protein
MVPRERTPPMSWNLMPPQQQRGSQLGDKAQGTAAREPFKDRGAQKHDEADQQLGGGPSAEIDYPATNPPDRRTDITPTLADDAGPNWDDVVQPENHSRQVPSQEQQARTDFSPDQHEQPLPEGK